VPNAWGKGSICGRTMYWFCIAKFRVFLKTVRIDRNKLSE